MISPLDTVDRLPGLGSSARASLEEHGIRSVADLIWTPPSGWDDLRTPRSVAEVVAEAKAAAGAPIRAAFHAVVVSASMIPMRGRRTVRVVLRDAKDVTCKLHAFWFFLAHGILAIAKPNTSVLVIGRVTVDAASSKKPPRMAHPELLADTPQTRTVRPRYPRLGPSAALVKKAIAHALTSLTSLRSPTSLTAATNDETAIDPIPSEIVKREAMQDAVSMLRRVHVADGELAPNDDDKRAFVERLAWTEAFTRAWERLLAEEGLGAAPATALPASPRTTKALEKALGFTLTEDQRAAASEVASDLASTRPMRRLLLGDVGTGKTAVALMAIAQCVAAGRQAAVLAPTSVLAEQYLAAVAPLEKAMPSSGGSGARVAFVAAGMPAAERRASEAAIASGTANVIIGTHALLGEAIEIPKLSLVVVDEQQRLGVGQRHALVKKGEKKQQQPQERPHLLTLSATPIPRTLALALRGELATSTLRELPAGRMHVATELASRSDIGAIILRAAAARDRNERVFWIVPRISRDDDEDDDDEAPTNDDDLASAETRAASLREYLGRMTVGILHGKMTAQDKRAAMHAFRSGASPVLVATTVVEVGVDVPEATLMVIEGAERFGLAQLHQLRGRVGRGAGERPGECILVQGDAVAGLARERLIAMTKLSTGEEIAHADLELRGAGDLGGSRQHGARAQMGEEELVFLDPNAAYAWLERIETDVRSLRGSDPNLEAPQHRVLGSIVKKLQRALALREEAG